MKASEWNNTDLVRPGAPFPFPFRPSGEQPLLTIAQRRSSQRHENYNKGHL